MTRPPPQALPPIESEQADLFDYALIRDWVGFIVGAPGRHRLMTLGLFVVIVSLAVAGVSVLPKTFHVEATLLAQRASSLAALGGRGDDVPTRAAFEMVQRHDNLVQLIKQTNLIENTIRTRSPASNFKEWLFNHLRRSPPTAEEVLDGYIQTLEKKLTVGTGDGTVTIAVDWSDAHSAYLLVERAQQNFLEARHVLEVSTITEAISILEGHAAKIQGDIGDLLDLLRRARLRTPVGRAKAPAPMVQNLLTPPRQEIDQERIQAQGILDAKRRAITDLEESKKRRLAELQQQVSQLRQIYTDANPLVISALQSIESLKEDTPQLVQLRQEVEQITTELAASGLAPPPAERPRPMAMPHEVSAPNDSGDPAIDYEAGRLRLEVTKYNQLLDRIDAMRIDLETAQAAFKYRYSVVRPAQLPPKPDKPKVPLVIGGAVVFGLMLGLFAAVFTDLRRGRVVVRWQVERELQLPVLSELERS